ncbi:beta-1,6-N-acetylglucosaminyltransferase [Megamonas funiformis]|uniref:beta-1,6-N-acetylglucosaminyltransferase n=1 Tax=Megamonas funiformis TaxID=437897 RepID=UPI003F97BB91
MKHAYLIVAHDQFYILEKLLKLLDDDRNDIFLHVDKKVKEFDFFYYKNLIKHSNIIFVKRLDVRWGDISLVKCTINLLESARTYGKKKYNKGYKYYHLISGVDLPIKTQNYIHKFLENKSFEFVHFAPDEDRKNIEFRYKYRCFFTKHLRKKGLYRIFNLLNKIGLYLQKKLDMDRTKNEKIKIMFGSNWFSITDDFVEYILRKKMWILNRFKYSVISDEEVVQTLVYNSEFYMKIYMKKEEQKNNDHIACMRKIDWKRGFPYTWTKNDYEELLESKCLFARKFDEDKDREIVDMIYNKLIKEKEKDFK